MGRGALQGGVRHMIEFSSPKPAMVTPGGATAWCVLQAAGSEAAGCWR